MSRSPSIFDDKAFDASALARLNDEIKRSVGDAGLALTAHKTLETYRSSIDGLLGPTGAMADYQRSMKDLAGSTGLDSVRALANNPALPLEVRAPKIPYMPPNPIHKTNDLLAQMTEKFERQSVLMTAMIDVEGKQADAVSELLQSSRESLSAANAAAEEQKAIAKRNLSIAIAGVVVAVVFGLAALFKSLA